MQLLEVSEDLEGGAVYTTTKRYYVCIRCTFFFHKIYYSISYHILWVWVALKTLGVVVLLHRGVLQQLKRVHLACTSAATKDRRRMVFTLLNSQNNTGEMDHGGAFHLPGSWGTPPYACGKRKQKHSRVRSAGHCHRFCVLFLNIVQQ